MVLKCLVFCSSVFPIPTLTFWYKSSLIEPGPIFLIPFMEETQIVKKTEIARDIVLLKLQSVWHTSNKCKRVNHDYVKPSIKCHDV